jgi:hypothetical protein
MPAQEPVVWIISMSKLVRCSRRWASSSLPLAIIQSRRSLSSALMALTAWLSVGRGVT